MNPKEIINILPVLVYGLEYDPRLGPQTGRITYCNMTTEKFIGFTEAEVVAMGFDFYRYVLHPDDLYKTTRTVTTLINSPELGEHIELYRVRSKNCEKYEFMKGICQILLPIEKDKPVPFVVTTLYATIKEIQQHQIKNNDDFNNLSKREKEIAFLLTQGLMDKEISEQLHISALTVKTHRTNIRKKLNVKNTVEMTSYLLPLFESNHKEALLKK